MTRDQGVNPQSEVGASTPVKRRIFVSTGEVSGDLQGSMLVRALYDRAKAEGIDLEVVALGGDRMAAAGAMLLAKTVTIGAVGIFESWPYLIPTLTLQSRVRQYLRQNPPDQVVLIDYMGPNLALGKFIREAFAHVPIAYYIAPQQWVWAFTPRDTERILSVADKLLAIFPEEARYYRERGGDVIWVGHPLIDSFPRQTDQQVARSQLNLPTDQRIVTLLPASRQQEIKYLMPIMFEAAKRLQSQMPNLMFLVPISLAAFQPQIEVAIQTYGLNAKVIVGQNRVAIAAADLAIAKSGTVNLETALMNVPQVVMYRLNRLTAWVAQFILKFSVRFVSPVNLTEMKPVVPEYIQWQATPEAIAQAALELLLDDEKRQSMLAGYQGMRQALGEPGVCDRAAHEILHLMQQGRSPS